MASNSGPALTLHWDPYPGFPDCQTQTKAWVKVTDKRVKKRFNPLRSLEHEIWHDLPGSSFQRMINEDVLQEIIDTRRMTCFSHLKLSRLVIAMITEADFDSKWKALGPEGREKCLLAGFRHAETTHLSVRGALGEKLNCPEITWDILANDDGGGFLKLMRVFLLDDNSKSPSRPFILENERFNKMIGWDENDENEFRKAWLDMVRLVRTLYISSAVDVTLSTYNGVEVKVETYTHEKHKIIRLLKEEKLSIDDILGPTRGKEYRNEQYQETKAMHLYCSNCMKVEKREEGGKMSICAKCKLAGRQVRYCSRECQKSAWKDHKRDCGKPLCIALALDDVIPVQRPGPHQSLARKDIPPSDANYKRSVDLLRLIQSLNESPDCDYIIFVPRPNRPGNQLPFKIIDIIRAVTFICMRNRALRNGDMAALSYIFSALQLLDHTEAVTEQLEKEYGAPFQTLLKDVARGNPPDVPLIELDEVISALICLKSTRRFGDELSSFDPDSPGATIMLDMRIGPNGDPGAKVEFPEFAMPSEMAPRTREYLQTTD